MLTRARSRRTACTTLPVEWFIFAPHDTPGSARTHASQSAAAGLENHDAAHFCSGHYVVLPRTDHHPGMSSHVPPRAPAGAPPTTSSNDPPPLAGTPPSACAAPTGTTPPDPPITTTPPPDAPSFSRSTPRAVGDRRHAVRLLVLLRSLLANQTKMTINSNAFSCPKTNKLSGGRSAAVSRTS